MRSSAVTIEASIAGMISLLFFCKEGSNGSLPWSVRPVAELYVWDCFGGGTAARVEGCGDERPALLETSQSQIRGLRRGAEPHDRSPSGGNPVLSLGVHLKTGHLSTVQNRPFRRAETGEGLPCGLFLAQVGVDLGTPAARSTSEDVRVMEESIEESSDRGGVSEELAPVIDWTV
jgi:hypothetical protein